MIRLGLKDKIPKSNGKIMLENFDFDTRSWGNRIYDLQSLCETEPQNIFVACGIEYFLLFGGFTNIFLGDDGIKTEKIHRMLTGLKKQHLEPNYFVYCPHNLNQENPENLKDNEYSLCEGCDVLSFYKHILDKNGN